MSGKPTEPCCSPGAVCQIDRREFLALGAAFGASLFAQSDAVAGPFEDSDFEKLIPADKKFKPEWIASLTDRGKPETFSGGDLKFIGMPIGGVAAGSLYLGGDGRLWLWDIFNRVAEGVVSKTVRYDGRPVGPRDGSLFVEPLDPLRPVDQGFALQFKTSDGEQIMPLDSAGFREVSFTGQYPIGVINYRDDRSPISVKLEAFSPFIPLNADDSSLPATVMSFTLTNHSHASVEATLSGWLENAVCLNHSDRAGVRRNQIGDHEEFTFLNCSVVNPKPDAKPTRPDIVFEDWSKDGYEGWTVEGKSFGSGPIRKKDIPNYQGDVGGPIPRVVNSHATAPGRDTGEKDGAVGKLSRSFVVERDYIHIWIGGGSHAGKTCVNLVSNGKIVRSLTGHNNNLMSLESINTRSLNGQSVVMEIVDAERGGWGNIGVGKITFSDTPGGEPLESLADFGTMGLALLGQPAEHKVAKVSAKGFGGKPSESAESELSDKLVGAIGRSIKLNAGESTTVNFVVTWHFPNLNLIGLLKGRLYAARFADARAVTTHVAKHFERLSTLTRTWRDTWYDSTLPYWFLNRTFSNTSILATNTCYRLADGRFWAWEGVGCCPGTCTHVWHYAQAVGRIFPELERDQRERVDFGMAFDDKTGVIRYRGEFGDTFAVDGQCGTILRAYREHQMSADSEFLKRVWPNIKRAMQAVIKHDRDGSGVLVGPMHNTLDADWFGVVPWLVGLFHAALRASEQMAKEMKDEAFAKECRAIFAKGVVALDGKTWREEYGYYVHVGDKDHLTEVGSYDGCHIDQVFGQSWAWQVGLGRVMDEKHTKQALKSLWKYGVAPDVGPFRKANQAGRWYAMPGDGGLLMVAFPFERPASVTGPGAWSAMYFNECMSGFEWQAASHMIWEGMVTEGLAVSKLIHDRYHPRLRNPYNEIECSDHYARAMASYGAYLAICGFAHHGPNGHIAFTPRITPNHFKAAFTAAGGWGTYAQTCNDGKLTASLTPKFGKIHLKTLGLEPPPGVKANSVVVKLAGVETPASIQQTGSGVIVTFESDVKIAVGQVLELVISHLN